MRAGSHPPIQPSTPCNQATTALTPRTTAPELLLKLADQALLDLVVGLEELVGHKYHNGLGLAHVHLLRRGDVQVLQVCLPLGVVALCLGWGGDKVGEKRRAGRVRTHTQRSQHTAWSRPRPSAQPNHHPRTSRARSSAATLLSHSSGSWPLGLTIFLPDMVAVPVVNHGGVGGWG